MPTPHFTFVPRYAVDGSVIMAPMFTHYSYEAPHKNRPTPPRMRRGKGAPRLFKGHRP